MCGSKPSEVTELFAGDIGAIGKLTNTRTGDTLSVKGTPVSYAKIGKIYYVIARALDKLN